MHQTISGETHNIVIKNRKSVDDFINDCAELYLFAEEKNNCMYETTEIVFDKGLNFLNSESVIKSNKELKKIIRKEYDDCEKIYPYLGDLFLNFYFKEKIKKNYTTFKFEEKRVNTFIKSLKNENVRQIANYVFKNCSLEYAVSIESYFGNDIVLKKYDNINFSIDYDYDYLGGRLHHKMKNYNFIIIDGVIESVGEVHHLLQQASENKEPYVIFCFGISNEVKKTILENNKRGITEIFPVCFNVEEDTINILNDIAVLHNSDVISSLKGQTISQEIRKKLKKGKEITLKRGIIEINPIVEDIKIKLHKKNLQKKISANTPTKTISLIEKRLKNLSKKSINIYVPDQIKSNNEFKRELDYFFRFLKHLNQDMVYLKNINNKKFYYVPISCVKLAISKVKSVKRIYENIEKLILFEVEK